MVIFSHSQNIYQNSIMTMSFIMFPAPASMNFCGDQKPLPLKTLPGHFLNSLSMTWASGLMLSWGIGLCVGEIWAAWQLLDGWNMCG